MPAVAPDSSDDPIKKKVLQIVAEKTGYPEDMLDLDLDLEADLGVDTVKQAEMFAAVRAAYNIPRDENLKLRDFPTLAHVIKFAHDRSAAMAVGTLLYSVKGRSSRTKADGRTFDPACAPRRSPASTPPIAFHAACLWRSCVLRLTFCKTTGVKLDRNSRVVLMPDKGGVGDALTKRLRAMGVEVLHHRERSRCRPR